MARDRQHTNKIMPQSTSLWEWIIGGIASVMVVALLGYLVYAAVTQADVPPSVEVHQLGEARPTAGGYVVEYEARNRSSATAAELTIRLEVSRDGTVVESQESVLDFLPSWSKRRGGFILRNDPAGGRVELRATGYREP